MLLLRSAPGARSAIVCGQDRQSRLPDAPFGAWLLKRVIQDALAGMLLAGNIRDGAAVHVNAGADGLIVGERVSWSGRQRSEDVKLP